MTLQRYFRLWMFLLVVIPSLLIMTIYTCNQIRIAKQQNFDMIYQRVLLQSRLIDYWLSERSTDIRKLSQLEEFRIEDEPQMVNTLELVQEGDTNFDSLSYIDKDGLFRTSTLQTGITFPSAVGKPYYEAAMQGKEYVSDVVVGRNSGLAIVNFSAPVYNYAGEVQGLILGSVKMSTLERLLQDNGIGQSGELFLVNRDGVMLTEPPHAHTLLEKGLVEGPIKMKLKISEDALHNIRLGESGTATWTDYLGNKVMGAYLGVPERGWTIIGKINAEEILSPIYQQLLLIAGFTLCLILLILPVAARLSNRIKQPIEWLIRQSKLVAQENYDKVYLDTCTQSSIGELYMLCNTFMKMSGKIRNTVAQLKENETILEGKVTEIQDMNAVLEAEISERQAAEEELRHLNASLEYKVRERTAALTEMNRVLQDKITQHQAVNKELNESRDALVKSEQQLKQYAAELADSNEKLVAANEELQRTSFLDGLTGIANRRYFDTSLEREWQNAKRHKTSLALLMLDIDFFKAYNDTYGHLAGDDCLKAIGGMLEQLPKRAGDIVARYGGEEFAFVLPDTDVQGAMLLAGRVQEGIEKLRIEHSGSSISNRVTLSIGVAVVTPEPEAAASSIITMADQALYQAKNQGRNRIFAAGDIETQTERLADFSI